MKDISDPGKKFEGVGLGDLGNPTEKEKEAHDFVENQIREFKNDLEQMDGGFFYGDVGTGKTSLMSIIWNEVAKFTDDMKKPPSMVWYYTPRLFVRIRREFEEEFPVRARDKCQTCSYLFLDDLGSENSSDWVVDSINAIIDYRYRECKPTFITSNEGRDKIIARYGQPTISRIFEMCQVFNMKGPDRRIE